MGPHWALDATLGDTQDHQLGESSGFLSPEVQNIDLMELAGFCRNCLSKWYRAAAEDKGIEMSYDDAREIVYGMPYGEWKTKHQTAQPKQRLDEFNATHHE